MSAGRGGPQPRGEEPHTRGGERALWGGLGGLMPHSSLLRGSLQSGGRVRLCVPCSSASCLGPSGSRVGLSPRSSASPLGHSDHRLIAVWRDVSAGLLRMRECLLLPVPPDRSGS
uniref:Uncharacterized protein n=1 Tax=Knipowitschia caucasica TaxID=637954 RepID=A0AAV2MHK7_KNICA